MIDRVRNLKTLIKHALILAMRPFTANPKVYELCTSHEIDLAWKKLLRPGDVVIQGGVNFQGSHISSAVRFGELLAPGGAVIAIEPIQDSLVTLEKWKQERAIDCTYFPVTAALHSKRQKGIFVLGRKNGWNRLESVPGSDNWAEDATGSRGEIEVEIRTIDDILDELTIAPSRVRYVNLTINGAEFETLKGMRRLLERADDLVVTVATGRSLADADKDGVAWIDGRRDLDVIADYLQSFGMRTQFRGYRPGSTGLLAGMKGSVPNFYGWPSPEHAEE